MIHRQKGFVNDIYVTPQEIINAANLTGPQRSEITMRRNDEWVERGRAADEDRWFVRADELMDVISQVKSYMCDTAKDNDWLLVLYTSAFWQSLVEYADKVNADRAWIKNILLNMHQQLRDDSLDPLLITIKRDLTDYYLKKITLKLPPLEKLRSYVFG